MAKVTKKALEDWKRKGTHRVTVDLSLSLYRKLAKEAGRMTTSVGAVVRQWLGEHPKAPR